MLKGKTALITGGATGIGFASARAFRENGARVAIMGKSQAKLDQAQAELGGDVVTICGDVTSLNDLAQTRTKLEGAFGTLDILFANAGVAMATAVATADEATYDKIMDVNVKGVFFTVQALLPLMRESGSIILNSAWLNQVGLSGRSVLSASKAAVRSFARTMSAELLDRKIRVNVVSPGSIVTPIHSGLQGSEDDFRDYVDRVGKQVPLGRMGQPKEIAAAVLFLASDASSYMLGAEIVIDGGRAEL